MTQKMPLLCYRLMMLLIGFIISIPCQATPNESQIIQYIIEESKKEEAERNKSALMLIRDFAYQKLRDYAKKDKAFAESLSFDTDEDSDHSSTDDVGIIPLTDGGILLTVSTDNIGPNQSELYFFLIHNKKSDWAPLLLDPHPEEKGNKTRSFMCGTLDYTTPLLKTHTRGSPMSCAECGETALFLFKDGKFKSELTIQTDILPSREEDDETDGFERSFEDLVVPPFTYSHHLNYINPDIIQLTKSCRSKIITAINDKNLMEKIYFATLPKVYFYEQAAEESKTKAYSVKGDALYVSNAQEPWVFACTLDPKSTKVRKGWVKKDELLNLDDRWGFIEYMNMSDDEIAGLMTQ